MNKKTEKITILVIEDDPVIMKTNCKALKLLGYSVLHADTIAKGRRITSQKKLDLILLDILLPDGNGVEFCREIRGGSNIPILFLSALGSNDNILAGLRAGGDDYISKPYDLDILMVKVEALLRRSRNIRQYEKDFLRMGNLKLDMRSRRAYLGDQDLVLKPREFSVLEVLIRQKGEPLNAVELYGKVWALETAGDVRTVWVHISTLRRKLGDPEKTGSPYLLFNRNSGYYLSLDDE
jgi:DNA-binding response OmpR family regulator